MEPDPPEKSTWSPYPPDPPPPPSLLYEFATDTSCHGVGKVAKADSKARKVVWSLALLGAFALATTMIGLRVQTYLEYSSVIEINKSFKTQLQFPAVTICNFNRLKKSYSNGDNAKAMAFLNDLMANQVYEDESTEICTECSDSQFKCLADVEQCCIPLLWKCDGYTDCMDSSDEANCAEYDNPLPFFDEAISICDDVTYTGSETEGLIKSPGFGSTPYANDLDCQISVPHQGRSYILADIWGEIESEGSGCEYDWLKVGDVSFCGLLERQVAIQVSSLSNGDSVNIVFQSDGSVAKDGFLLHWYLSDTNEGLEVLNSSAVTPATGNYDGGHYASSPAPTHNDLQNSSIPMVNICDVNGQTLNINDSLIILSHDLYMSGEVYPDNLNCQVSITGVNLEMHLHEIGVDGTYPACDTDHLTVEADVDGENHTYCGVDKGDFTPVSGANTIDLSFFSNNDGSTGVGFALIVRGLQPGNMSDYYADDADGWVKRRRRYLTPVNLYDVTRQRRHKRNTNSTTKTSTEASIDLATTKFSQIIRDGGWQLEDNVIPTNLSEQTFGTLLHCSYRGVKCNKQWFEHTFTKFGNCYTFNVEKLLKKDLVKPLDVPLMQVQPGPLHGLDLLLDVQRHEYSEKYKTGNPQLGLKFQVHPSTENPDVGNQGLAIGTGQHAYVGFKIKQNINLEPPWGICNKSLALKYSDQYSFHQCAIECKLEYVVNACRCKPFYYPGPDPECSAAELKSCAYPAIEHKSDCRHHHQPARLQARIDTLFADECLCPVSCNYTDVDMRMSYSEFGASDTIKTEMNTEFYGLSSNAHPRDMIDFYQKNIVSLNIYYEELSETVYKQLKAMDASSLLSDLGGQLGLFIGVSVLTVCELLETIMLACLNCTKKRRKTRAVEAWEKVVNQARQQPA